MSLFDQFQMDEKKEAEGIPMTFAPNADGTVPTFIIARASTSNTRYMKSLERHTRPYRRLIDSQMLDPKTSDKIRRQIFIETLLVKWENIHDANGKAIPFNAQEAEKLFVALPELFNELNEAATKANLFRAETQENEAKN